MIKSAEEVQKSVTRHKTKIAKERRQFVLRTAIESKVSFLRDATVNIVGDTKLQDIQDRGGATPSTIRRWQRKQVVSPKLTTLLSTLDACGYDLKLIKKGH
jgi:hypothetical protein